MTTPEPPEVAAPATSETPPDSSGEVVDSVDWAGVSSEEDDFVEPQVEAKAESPAEPAVQPATPEPATPAVPVVTPEAATPVVPPVVPPVAPTVVTEAPVASVIDQAAEDARILGDLEKAYSMTEEDALAFQTEPELVLPKLAAKLHMDIAKDVMNGLKSVMPEMIQQLSLRTAAEEKAKNTFYEANPDLNDPKLVPYIMQCGQLFRSVNKDAPADQAVVLIGNMVRQALGMPPLNKNPEVPEVQTPVTSIPQTVAKPHPFSPSRGGGGAAVPAAQPLSTWEQMAIDDD